MDYLIRNTTLGLPVLMLFIAIVVTGKTGNVVAVLHKYGKNRKTAKCAIGLWHFTDLADFSAAGLYSHRSLSSQQKIGVLKIHTGRNVGSDHLPLITDLVI